MYVLAHNHALTVSGLYEHLPDSISPRGLLGPWIANAECWIALPVHGLCPVGVLVEMKRSKVYSEINKDVLV